MGSGWAERLLRRHPQHVTLLSPLVTYLFTLVAGTGHVAYSVLPVIAEVATETKIRPERPLGIGRYVLNHSFMIPGLIATAVSIALGLLFIRM